MIKTPISLQDLRRSLYIKAKAEPTWRFWGLYVHVCKMETLQEAYQKAKSNVGCTPGLRHRFKGVVTVRCKTIVIARCFDCILVFVLDRGFFLTLHAVRRQLAAMPNDFYFIRMIHGSTRRPCPGERVWDV